MASESMEVTDVIPASPERVYSAWLSSVEHSEMTGGRAEIDASVGGAFTAWDGYIQGSTLELEPGRRIVQSWRTTEFPEESPPSRLEVRLEADLGGGTRISIRHTEIPQGQGERYRLGWSEHYFEPMKRYFSRTAPRAVAEEERRRAAPAKKKPAAKKAAPKLVAAKKKPAAKKAAPKRAAAKKKPAAKKAAPKRAAAKRKSAAKKSARSAAAKKKKPAAKKSTRKSTARKTAKKRR